MAEGPVSVPIHPVAPRLANGPKKPHVGPNLDAYKAAHAQTLGHESDKWWAKVSPK
jgi:acetyl-CoA synthetase